MIEAYIQHREERSLLGIPALPINQEQIFELCEMLKTPPPGMEELLLKLLSECVSPDAEPSARAKAEFLSNIVDGSTKTPLLTPLAATRMLGTMQGGHNVAPLVKALQNKDLADEASNALKKITCAGSAFDEIAALAEAGSSAAIRVIKSWADAEWFTSRSDVPAKITLKVFKIDGPINTEDLSPETDACNKHDIPLHALSMCKARFPDALKTISKFRDEGYQIAFVADTFVGGTFHKSAINNLLWTVGKDIPCVPDRRSSSIIIGSEISSAFMDPARDLGALPIKADVSGMKTGDIIIIDTWNGEITEGNGKTILAEFQFNPKNLIDEFRSGGRVSFNIGYSITERARKLLGLAPSKLFIQTEEALPKLQQHMVPATNKIVAQNFDVASFISSTNFGPWVSSTGESLAANGLGAVTALFGRLPKPEEYIQFYMEQIEPDKANI